MTRSNRGRRYQDYPQFFHVKAKELDKEFDRNNDSRVARGEEVLTREEFDRQRKGSK